METVSDFIFLGSKITADGDRSLELKKKKSVALAMYIGKQDSLKVSELYV